MNKTQLWKHVAALIYDIFPILALFLTTSLLSIMLRQGEEVQPSTWWFQGLLLLEVYFYFAYSWKKGGHTLGMRAWKIQIHSFNKLSWTQVTLRFFTGLISTLLMGAGLWSRRFSNKKWTWMDYSCGQTVIDVSMRQPQPH